SLYMARTHATTTHTLPLHDALPIYPDPHGRDDFVEVNGVNIPRPGATSAEPSVPAPDGMAPPQAAPDPGPSRASMLSGATVRPQIGRHTSELQSRENLVCRLLLEKK